MSVIERITGGDIIAPSPPSVEAALLPAPTEEVGVLPTDFATYYTDKFEDIRDLMPYKIDDIVRDLWAGEGISDLGQAGLRFIVEVLLTIGYDSDQIKLKLEFIRDFYGFSFDDIRPIVDSVNSET